MADQLSQLRQVSVVVADSGDINGLKKTRPTDATTNPSLLLKAAQMKEYQHLIDDGIKYAMGKSSDPKQRVRWAMDRIAVNFGKEILGIVPGLVSTECDARTSFSTQDTVEQARRIIEMYKEVGVPRDRILIKIASTWEGIRAAEILEREGIHCNLTLLFSLAQAIACADAKVTLISPFVGRILDWHRAKTGKQYSAEQDPGVVSVKSIYNYYKKFGIQTVVMAASFRSREEVLALAGCDKLTISPSILEELARSTAPVQRVLQPDQARRMDIKRVSLDESRFRWAMNEDAMATEKLAEGIRQFTADAIKLEQAIAKRCGVCKL